MFDKKIENMQIELQKVKDKQNFALNEYDAIRKEFKVLLDNKATEIKKYLEEISGLHEYIDIIRDMTTIEDKNLALKKVIEVLDEADHWRYEVLIK